MIISVDELKKNINCGDMSDTKILSWLKSIESTIRAFTQNNFQNRNIRFKAESSSNGCLLGVSPFLRVGDTVQISKSGVNDGLYTVVDISEGQTMLDREIFPVPSNLVTKIEYPDDVIQCAVDLFEWKKEFGGKVGIKSESETLSRHSESVTYEDSSTLFMGYPTGILKGLSSIHFKARF